MLITRWIDYGVRIMLTLALEPERSLNANEIAKACDISRPAALRLIRQLAMAKLVETRRGPGGGVKLGREATAVTFKDIIEATDSRRAVNPCLVEDHFCGRDKHCAVHRLLEPLQQHVDDFFAGVTLAKMVDEQRKILDGQ